jgi:chromosomal replication initiator protein
MPVVDRSLWQSIIQNVVAAGGNIIRPWFTELEPICLEHGLLEIEVPGRDEQKYCQDHAVTLFTEAAQQATGRLIGVCFLTRAQADSAAEGGQYVAEVVSDDDMMTALGGDYHFDSFVQGPCNRLAFAASVAIADAPGKAYNPLFLHGSVGLGKTHLLHAICRKIKADNPAAKICVLSCETFVNHFIAAVERGHLHEFRYRYRHVDLLAIDDIQFLREQTQEEFFHTFNTLYQAQKQIVLTSDREPKEIHHLEERLISRLNWGLVARIDKPCYETRVAIVHKKARARTIALPEDVVCFIAGSIESNSRELEGAISRVAMLAAVLDRPIDLHLAEQALGAKGTRRRERQITIEDILKAVTGHFRVRLSDLQSRKRSRSIALPRQICMFLARSLTRHSLEEIGGYFGGRDHTTVLHANKTVDNLCKKNPELQATLQTLTQEISADSAQS